MLQASLSIAKLEAVLGYSFKQKELLGTALVTPSCKQFLPEGAEDNQRLEFLGDAVFGLLSAEQVYKANAGEDEGALTVRRAHLASGEALAALASTINLGDYLLLSPGEEKCGGRAKQKHLADAMEAVFGAAWCDGGLDACRKIYDKLGVNGLDLLPVVQLRAENPKGELQQFCQARKWGNPVYELVAEEGPAHDPRYTVRVVAANGESAEATASSKRKAQAEAARVLLARLECQVSST